jgi:hypothetical protein
MPTVLLYVPTALSSAGIDLRIDTFVTRPSTPRTIAVTKRPPVLDLSSLSGYRASRP